MKIQTSGYLRGAGGGEGGQKKKYQEEGSSSILPAKKVKDGGVLGPSAENVEDGEGSSFFGTRSPTPSSSVRSSTHSSKPKIEDGGFFDLRLRRSNIEDGGTLRSSASRIDDGKGFFDLRLRRTKMEESSIVGSENRKLKIGVLRSSGPKIENGGSSIFASEERRRRSSSRKGGSSRKGRFFEEGRGIFEEQRGGSSKKGKGIIRRRGGSSKKGRFEEEQFL